jgi:5'-3' exonuclease
VATAVHLVDGTYELFRAFFGAPKALDATGREVGATRGFLGSLHRLLRDAPVTHAAVAFDHVIESFRNKLYSGYKTGEGVDPLLLSQFPLAEEAVSALGVVVWPMVEFEADDAMATAARRFQKEAAVKQVVLCSPDKDLAQLVSGKKVVCWDRKREIVIDEKGVLEKFGVKPESMADWLALVGDAADGYPGIPGWGEKSAASVLTKYKHIEAIPDLASKWKVPSISAGRAVRLAENLSSRRAQAMLFKKLATVREDVPLKEKLSDLEWIGAWPRLKDVLLRFGDERIAPRVPRWRPRN